MNYFRSTFYNNYTPLTEGQIFAKLRPTPAATSVSPLSETLAGRALKIILDDGPMLEYTFESRDKLTFSEGGSAAVTAPYSAKELDGVILFTHMIPETVRGYGIVYDTKTDLVTAFELWFCGFEPDKREVWRHFMSGYVDTGVAGQWGINPIKCRLHDFY